MLYFCRHYSITTVYYLRVCSISNGALPVYLLPSLPLFLSLSLFPFLSLPLPSPSPSLPSLLPLSSLLIHSHKEEEMQKSDNCIENLVTKAQSSNMDEQFAAVQALRFTSSPCSTCSSCASSHFPTSLTGKFFQQLKNLPSMKPLSELNIQ